jgi:hypothetical protein
VKKSFELPQAQLEQHHRDWREEDHDDELAEALHGKWLHFVSFDSFSLHSEPQEAAVRPPLAYCSPFFCLR